MAEYAADWSDIRTLLIQYQSVTREISDWFDEHTHDEDELSLDGLERLLKRRQSIIDTDWGTIDMDSLPESPDREMCMTMLRDIQTTEAENSGRMRKWQSGFKERLRNQKQARDTVGAYQQTYAAAQAGSVGSIFNKTQ